MAKRSSTYLFVPGDRPELYSKAAQSGGDGVVLDLEDGVSAADRPAARINIGRWLRSGNRAYVRVNPLSTSENADDLKAVFQAGLRGVFVPKAESPAMLRSLVTRMPWATEVIPMIESARGMANIHGIARVRGVSRLAFGDIDFRLDLGMGREADLDCFRSLMVLASRTAEIEPPVDGITQDLSDGPKLRADSRRAYQLGFGGKLCIHPSQVPVVHQCFRPSASDVAWARQVVSAEEEHGTAVFRVAGQMIDRPLLVRARRILESLEPD